MTTTITLYLLTLVLPLMTILIIFVLRYYAGIQQTKAWQAHEDAYRQLAERVAAVQSQIATSMAAVESNLSDMRTRMAAVENILKAVE